MNAKNDKILSGYNNRFSKETSEAFVWEILNKKANTLQKIADLKRIFSKKNKVNCPSNPALLAAYRKLVEEKTVKYDKKIEELFKIHRIRTLSGVAVIAVLTKPAGCPGQCVYCPTEKDLPKSYLPDEPAVMRAVLNNFDPFDQVRTRLKSLAITGHETDKIELIIIGGTFSALPKKYKIWYIKRCFEACNTIKSKVENRQSKKLSEIQNLKKVQKENEKAEHRIIGITVETRPDYIDDREIKLLRQLGVTRVELGVQSIYDDILNLCKRGHTVQQTAEATKLLKDAGFKIGYHMMPNLPGATPEKDLETFRELFENPDFQPDILKIYPTVVTKNSELYDWWKKGEYSPYDDKTLLELLLGIKKLIPPYVRISRLIRDIPAKNIISGSKVSNLRQTLDAESKKQGWHCRCIRCREIKNSSPANASAELKRIDYDASGGKEIFLSFEDTKNDKLYALLKLRIPSFVFNKSPKKQKYTLPVLKNAAIIREVHTYGQLVPISRQVKGATQHAGLGKQLIAEAERIAREEFNIISRINKTTRKNGIKSAYGGPAVGGKIAVISGVGVRDYYQKLGYKLKNEYMIKKLD